MDKELIKKYYKPFKKRIRDYCKGNHGIVSFMTIVNCWHQEDEDIPKKDLVLLTEDILIGLEQEGILKETDKPKEFETFETGYSYYEIN